MPDEIDDIKIRTLKLLINNIRSVVELQFMSLKLNIHLEHSQRRPLRDTTASNALQRFDSAICKKFATQLDGMNEDEYRKLEELKDLFEFLDDIIPDDDVEEVEVPKRTSRKRWTASF